MVGGGAPKNTIAVLPLQNMNGDISVEFLRTALADEISNTLTYTRTLNRAAIGDDAEVRR